MQAWDHRSCLVHAKKKIEEEKNLISGNKTEDRNSYLLFPFRYIFCRSCQSDGAKRWKRQKNSAKIITRSTSRNYDPLIRHVSPSSVRNNRETDYNYTS